MTTAAAAEPAVIQKLSTLDRFLPVWILAAMVTASIARLRREGGDIARLRPCQPESRDAIALPNCVMLYLPDATGAWGIVLAFRLDAHGRPYLRLLAFGQRHPHQPGHPSAYQIAAIRLAHL